MNPRLPLLPIGWPPSRAQWAKAMRIGAITFLINSAVALLVVPALTNTYQDLWVSAQVVGFTILAFLLPALRLSPPGRPRILLVAGALFSGAVVGTVLVVLVKGRELSSVLADPEYFSRFATTATTGLFFGAIISLVMAVRARIAVAEMELMRTEAERQRLARQTAEAHLQLLKAQIEPHFLFNTLANLRYLILKDPATAAGMLDSLIEYLQAAMPRMRGETSTLGQEVAMCEAYLHIHKIRMGERLDFSVDVPKSIFDTPFPPMMLITLIENALKHGLGPQPAGGRISIVAEAGDGCIAVSVADTGPGPTPQALSGKADGVGYSNIRERLAALYAGTGRFSVSTNVPHGCIARIEVPLAG